MTTETYSGGLAFCAPAQNHDFASLPRDRFARLFDGVFFLGLRATNTEKVYIACPEIQEPISDLAFLFNKGLAQEMEAGKESGRQLPASLKRGGLAWGRGRPSLKAKSMAKS